MHKYTDANLKRERKSLWAGPVANAARPGTASGHRSTWGEG